MTTDLNHGVKKDFFVSYNSADKEWAVWIAFQLEAHDYKVVIQAWDFAPGNNFILEMQKAARTCERTIIVLSQAFLDALYTQPEWAQAFHRDPTGEKGLLIPVRVQECELQGLFGPVVYIDFLEEKPPTSKDLRDHLAELLLNGVKIGRKKPETEPPVPSFRKGIEKSFPPESKERRNDESEPVEANNEIFGESRNLVSASLKRDWLQSRRVVALLQGFPGTGKSTLALSLESEDLIRMDPVPVSTGSENREIDLLMDLATSLQLLGFEELALELEKGDASNPLAALRRLIRQKKVLIVIDEFQRLFSKDHTCPPENWQEFIESLNNASVSEGKLLLISNRIVSPDRWNEGCVVRELQKLPDLEAANFLRECLLEHNIEDRIPSERLAEIGRRLGGNPRAIKTLVGALLYYSIDELLSGMPEELETGDVTINRRLLEQFERGLICLAIDQLGTREIQFMRWLAVNRRPVGRSFYSGLNDLFPDWEEKRILLIHRFLLEAKSSGDVMHPLAREIAVSRLRGDDDDWKHAHKRAADYQLELFDAGSRGSGKPRAASFVEVRHHLFEAGRLAEISNISARMRSFVLSRMPKPTHSRVPTSTEILEEHIVLIESLPDAERSKSLSFHLALCLKQRNCPGDYEVALVQARKATGPRVYYAVWLLLADLEFILNGAEAMMTVANRAFENLGAGSNAFAVYHHCADHLDKDGRTNEAIGFLEKAIRTPRVECKSSLIAMCVRFLEKTGQSDRASKMLSSAMEGGNLKEEGIIFIRWASTLIEQEQPEEAIRLLDRAIAQKEITKLFALYLIKARALVCLGKVELAIVALQNGIDDRRVIDPVELFRELAKLLATQGKIEDAVVLLQSAVSHKAIRNIGRLFHSTADILEKSGEFYLGAELLKKALEKPALRNDHTIYMLCAKLFFRAEKLDEAANVLKQGLRMPNLRERNQLTVKLAEINYKKGSTQQAIDLLRDAIEFETDPRHFGKVYQYCSELLEVAGETAEAEAILRKGISAPAITDKSVLVQALAKNLANQKRGQEAIDLLQEAVKWPGISGVVILYQICGKILAKLGRIDDAITMLRDGMENKTIGNLGSLYAQSADLMAMSGKHSEAITLLQKGIKEFPKDQSLKDLLGKLAGKRRR